MTLRRDASEVEKAALDEKSNATRGVSDTRGQWKSVTQTIFHSQRQLVSLKRQWSKRTGHSLNEAYTQIKGKYNTNSRLLCVTNPQTAHQVSMFTEWGHSFFFKKGNSCMILHRGTRVKLTQKILFTLPCTVLDFKMSFNRIKLQREKGHMYCNKREVAWRKERKLIRNDPETRCIGGWESSTRWKI